ncbi:MAG: hypothetical protein GX542_01625, partial [Rhodococcus sp.]|nr:hypothetical protein [Rhodococcus sp. (in: high G+C Gram-positive bacteria)]
YRMPTAETGLSPLLQSSFNADEVREVIRTAAEITEDGTETIEGQDTTRYEVTVDKEAAIDAMLIAMGVPAEQEIDPQMRSAIADQVPTKITYWVSGDGMLIRQDDGRQVKTHSNIGEQIALPEINEADVRPMPVG